MCSTGCPSSSGSYSRLLPWRCLLGRVPAYLHNLCCPTLGTRGRSSLCSVDRGGTSCSKLLSCALFVVLASALALSYTCRTCFLSYLHLSYLLWQYIY